MIIKTIVPNKNGYLKTKIQGYRLVSGESVVVKFATLEEYNTLLRSGFFFESNKGEDIPVIRAPYTINTLRGVKSLSPLKEEKVETQPVSPEQTKTCSMCDTNMMITFTNIDGEDKEIYICPKCDYEEDSDESKQVEENEEKPKRKRRKSKKDKQQEIEDSFE